MSKHSNQHMSTDEFRKQGKKVIDWIADYYDQIEQYPVLSQVNPGDIRSNLPQSAPIKGRDYGDILSDMDKMMPGITHWQSPNFHGFFPCATSGPAILGDLISTGLGINGMNWTTSPSCTEVETHVLDWLVDMMDLPNKFKSNSTGGGVLQDTASSSSLVALIAAREKASNGQINKNGGNQRLTAYSSSQAHSSIEKAVKIAGIGKDSLRLIKVDDSFAMNPKHLRESIETDISNGFTPTFVCATVGTTSSTALDPIEDIGKICLEFNIWLHVDAALAGPAALCPEFRFIHDGLEYADSYTFNPHKWMLTNFDCSCLFIKNRDELISALRIMPEYLNNQSSKSGEVIDYRDWQIPLGRRFRSLKLWTVIRYYGIEGLQNYVRHHINIAQQFLSWVKSDERFEIMAPAPLNLICFRAKGSDKLNKDLLNYINNSGEIYITHTRLNDLFTLRLCVGQTHTDVNHVKEAWGLIKSGLEKIKG